MTDIQLRTGGQFKYLQNVLARPGLLYHLNDKHSVGVGYTYFATWDQSKLPHSFTSENRIFEQYILKLTSGRLVLNIVSGLNKDSFKNSEKIYLHNGYATRYRLKFASVRTQLLKKDGM